MRYLIKNVRVVNEGEINRQDVLLENGLIAQIDRQIDANGNVKEISADHLNVLPGVIDDQLQFREPGPTHKREIYTEAKAAVAGGITSYMEMPNTIPQSTTITELEKKYQPASACSRANYTFYLG